MATQIENIEKVTENKALWERTNDALGIRPKFPVFCQICLAAHDKRVLMVLRRSRIHRVADIRMIKGIEEHRPYAADMAFKCPECGWYTVFGVAMDPTHAQLVIAMREGKHDFVLPEEIWADDDRVREQLEKWGYFGGGVDYQSENGQSEVKEGVQ